MSLFTQTIRFSSIIHHTKMRRPRYLLHRLCTCVNNAQFLLATYLQVPRLFIGCYFDYVGTARLYYTYTYIHVCVLYMCVTCLTWRHSNIQIEGAYELHAARVEEYRCEHICIVLYSVHQRYPNLHKNENVSKLS